MCAMCELWPLLDRARASLLHRVSHITVRGGVGPPQPALICIITYALLQCGAALTVHCHVEISIECVAVPQDGHAGVGTCMPQVVGRDNGQRAGPSCESISVADLLSVHLPCVRVDIHC